MDIDFERRCWVEIDLDNLRHNFSLIKKQAGNAKVMAVVKANAYGHGDLITARTLAEAGAERFAVSGLTEAVRLREGGLSQPVMVLGYTSPQHTARLQEYHITQCIFSLEYARQLSQAAVESGAFIRVHYKVDTGMGRLGFNAKDHVDRAVEELAEAGALPNLIPSGLFTHFPVADSLVESDIAYTRRQFELFNRVHGQLEKRGLHFGSVHCCNSAAMVAYPEMHLDIVRPGILLYGCNPSQAVCLPGLRPALSLKTMVTQVKEILAGDCVSYGRLFTAPKDMTVATLSVGYADGYNRLMSGCGVVGINDQPAPLLGRVCMDQLVVDVTGIPGVHQGSVATVFGGGGADSIDEVAAKCGTINYEVLCNIGQRVQRVYLEKGQEVFLADYN